MFYSWLDKHDDRGQQALRAPRPQGTPSSHAGFQRVHASEVDNETPNLAAAYTMPVGQALSNDEFHLGQDFWNCERCISCFERANGPRHLSASRRGHAVPFVELGPF